MICIVYLKVLKSSRKFSLENLSLTSRKFGLISLKSSLLEPSDCEMEQNHSVLREAILLQISSRGEWVLRSKHDSDQSSRVLKLVLLPAKRK